MQIINVGVADLQVGQAPTVFKTIVGSCMGIALYDPQQRAGGLAHVMLPLRKGEDENVAKYANTAIPALVTELERRFGSSRRQLRAKIAGGASMFGYKKQLQQMLDIGNNNIKATRFCLEKMNIPVVGEDVGHNYGRRLEFHVDGGLVRVTAQGRPAVEL